MDRANRNHGVDILRVVSLVGVVILHILGHGGVINASEPGLSYKTVWMIEILAYPAVDCFVLISGFVGYRNEKYFPKLKNIISLLFTVFFYSVSICAIIQIISPAEIGFKDIFQAFFPILTKQYWFVNTYFAMFLFSPVINLFVYNANARMLSLSFGAVVILAFIETFTGAFAFNSGYSFVWFVLLYLIGAIIKKCDIHNKIANPFCVVGFAIMLLLTWLMKIYFQSSGIELLDILNIGYQFVSYCCPAILFMAIFSLCFFSKIKISKKMNNAISFLSSSAFSVYLIHENKHIRRLLIQDKFVFLADKNLFEAVILIVAFAIGIYLICMIIDKIRILIFKFLKVDNISVKLESLIKRLFEKLFAFFTDKVSRNI